MLNVRLRQVLHYQDHISIRILLPGLVSIAKLQTGLQRHLLFRLSNC